MKQRVFLMLLLIVVMASCQKSNTTTASLLIFNATHSTSDLSAKWNGSSVTSSTLSQGQFTGTNGKPYLTVPAGTNDLNLFSGTNSFSEKNVYAGGGLYYSLLVYDTNATTVSRNVIMLTDDISLPDTANAKWRFINCSADTVVDVKLLHQNDTTVLTSGSAFIGDAPVATNLQTFSLIKHGTYKLNIYNTGTNQVLYSPSDSVVLGSQKIISFIFRGTAGGTGVNALQLNSIDHGSH